MAPQLPHAPAPSLVSVSMPFMLLKRAVIERTIAAYPETRYNSAHAYSSSKTDQNYVLFDCIIDKEAGVLSARISPFCQRWWHIDGKIWLDTEGKFTQIGAYKFRGDPKARYAREILLDLSLP